MDDYTLKLSNPKNNCPYIVFDDENFVLSESDMPCKFQVLHLNLCSFPKNEVKLKLLLDDLNTLNVSFDVILICESFLTELSIKLVDIPGYKYY